LRRVSCSTWHYCISYRQETICEGFPIRLDAIVFQCGRKLSADSFLLDMALLCFLPAGNYLRMVSYSTWHYRVSCRQETFSPGDFSTPLEMTGAAWQQWGHDGRKRFTKGFLFDLTPLCFNAAGNFLRIVSCSTWHYCVSYRQETICEWFPIRHSNTVFHCDRKLFAKGFLFDMAPLCFLPAGNYLRRVSYSTWHHCVSCRQETICEGFPGRHDAIDIHTDRKLFAYGFLCGMALWGGMMTFRQTTKKRSPMAPLFVIPYFSDV
jgi:hypothetical protein